jgi:hypothetical protein
MHRSLRTLVAFAVAVASASVTSVSFAQLDPARQETMISAADLHQDVLLLRRVYEELHPGLYRYNTPPQMASHFAELDRRLSRDQTLASAYLAVSQFLARIECGHTQANFFNQSDSVVAELFDRGGRVPFYFRWLDRRMVITKNFSGDARLTPGTEVLAIDGVPAATVLDSLLTISRADGSNDYKRLSNLEVQGFDRWETFDIFRSLFFPGREDSLRLRLRALDGKTTMLAAKALTQREREALAPKSTTESKTDAALFESKFLDARSAYLRMPTWATYDSKWDWRGYLDSFLDTVVTRGATRLIVDLRGNEGGEDVGNLILQRLIDQDLPLAQYRRFVRYRAVPADLNPYLDTWDKSFRDWGAFAREPKNADGFYRLTKWDDDSTGSVVQPKGKRFRGRVLVLVDGSNSSATFQFASAVQQARLGQLVGAPTGGNRRGINGSAFFFVRLPRSHIEVDLPLVAEFPTSRQPDAGLIPDVVVRSTPADIAKGRDAVLMAALRVPLK